MKKRLLALLLILGITVGNTQGITVVASGLEHENISKETSVNTKEDMSVEEGVTEEVPKENEEVETEISEATPTEDSASTENQGEYAVDEQNINVVDKDGNVTFIDVTKDDAIVPSMLAERELEPQIVNLRQTSGVLNYNEVGTGAAGYVAGAYGADAAFLGTDGGNVKFMIGGVVGEVANSKVQIVSKSDAKSVSYYAVSSGRLYHYITTNVNSTSYGSTLDNGPAPSYLKSGVKYYSYDGHYFYTESNFEEMLGDYNKNVRTHAVNANNPYYNYFQYLPLRSQSNYSGSVLNSIINKRVASDSKMKDTGVEFTEDQNLYGVNALLMVGIAANESGWGSSNIAKTKNNLFGLNAVDSSPGQSANYFASIEQCITEFAEKWMSKEYLNPKNWKYYGAFLGNKGSGMNIKYASDPYWGEKAASMAWNLDKGNGNKDFNKYTLGIKDPIVPNNTVNIRKDSNTSSTVLFKTPKQSNCAYIILNKTAVNKFYKIQSDGVLNSGRTAINTSSGIYDFKNMYAYISADYLRIVNNGTGGGTTDPLPEPDNWKVNGIKINMTSPQPVDSAITLTADVSGNISNLQYKFVWMKDNWKEWGVIQNFSGKNTAVWKATSGGNYTIFLDVKKGNGSAKTVNKTYQILNWGYTSVTTNVASPQTLGKSITVSANVKGATSGLKYKFVWEKDNWKEWGVIQALSTKNSAVWKPTKVGNYVLHVDVRDTSGHTITMTKKFNIENVSWNPGELEISSKEIEIGKEVTLKQTIKSSADNLPLQYKFVWEKDNWKEWGVIREFSSKNSVKWIPAVMGKCTVHVDVKDDTGKVVTKKSMVDIQKGTWKYVEIKPNKKSPQYINDRIKFEVLTDGNAYGVQYKFVWQKNNWKEWGVIRSFSPENSATWIPKESGNYTIIVDMKDLDGKVLTKEISYEIAKSYFDSVQITPDTAQNVGGKIHIKANYKGATAKTQYKFVWQKDDWKEWGVISPMSNENSVDWVPKSIGNYTICVDVKNDEGKIQTKTKSFPVGGWIYKDIEISKKTNTSYLIQPKIQGNTSGFTYKYVWQKNNWKEWGIIKNFSSDDSAEWKPKTSGNYTICVDVKDANGKVITTQKQCQIK